MSENNEPGPEVPEPPETPATSDTPATPEAEAPAKRRFRDRFAGTGERLRGTRGLFAATLAALVVGGFGGAAIHAAVDGDDHDHGRFFFRGDHPGELGRDFGGWRGDGERPALPPEFREGPDFPGPVPPTTTPSESSES